MMRAIDLILLSLSAFGAITFSTATDEILGNSVSHDAAFEQIVKSSRLGRRVIRTPQYPTDRDSQPVINRRGSTNPSSLYDLKQFSDSADSNCQNAVKKLDSVVNPSGLAACYNVPFFDEVTGSFAANVRLFKASKARAEFAGVPFDDHTMQIAIPEAEISPAERMNQHAGRNGNSAMMLEFQHVGKLNPLLQLEKLEPASLRLLLIPNITVLSTNPRENGEQISTTFSSDTISYVAGRFSEGSKPFNITVPEAKSQIPIILASATEFILPGTTVEVFPIGLLVTCIWSGLFLGIIAYGTIGRKRFRDHYRNRVKMALAAGDDKPPGF